MCHHRSAPCMIVKPNDQNVRPAARCHVAVTSRSEAGLDDVIPASAREAGDGGRGGLPAALGTLLRLNRRPSARACPREAGGDGASQFAGTAAVRGTSHEATTLPRPPHPAAGCNATDTSTVLVSKSSGDRADGRERPARAGRRDSRAPAGAPYPYRRSASPGGRHAAG